MAFEVFTKQYQKSGPSKMKYWELIDRFPKLLSALQKDLVMYRKEFRGLTDAHVLEAISLLLKSYETEAKGILYQHRSYQAQVQTLINRLTETIEEVRQHSDKHGRIAVRDIVDCLASLKDQVEFHIEENISTTGYLDFITPFHPDVNPRADKPRIIIL